MKFTEVPTPFEVGRVGRQYYDCPCCPGLLLWIRRKGIDPNGGVPTIHYSGKCAFNRDYAIPNHATQDWTKPDEI